MPLKLPAPILHLQAFFRPSLLRPDLKAASVDHVDWFGLRRAGWNAVVIDKDNCLVSLGRRPPLRYPWLC